ncbi:MAG: hypothetical protein HKN91_02780 [Acidimicrobiia bacterium]|nr:hypothetical protein [Acidimicrobiia bacterium]
MLARARGVCNTTINPSTMQAWNDYNPQWDLDNPTFPNGSALVLFDSITVTPTLSWQMAETDKWVENSWEGVDVRIRVDNDLQGNGGNADLEVDWVRARHVP